MPPDPPVPIHAGWVAFLSTARITFDLPLAVGVYDDRNWFIRWNNQEYEAAVVSVGGGNPLRVIITTGAVVPDVGPNIVQYNPGVPDLIGQNGRLVAPFVIALVPA